MTLSADLYFSFRSPYSYLAIGRYRRMAEEYDLDIALRIVWPIAVRNPDLLFTGNPAAPRYILMDSMRAGAFEGIPIRWPRPDPIVQDLETRAIAKEQPLIRRVCRIGQAAVRRGKGMAFADEVSKIIFDGETDGWNEGDHLANAAARAGLDLAELDAEAISDADGLDAEIAANQDALEAAGHWGVPTLVFEGEPFFGQDRVAMAQWRMEQRGLAPRDMS
ncbi:MAG: DsbA family protein [Erythrobacter sp.]|nr:DsbA family protein [Erythrobacter sp.]